MSSTVRPTGQRAVEVVTTPAVLTTGAAQWSMWRQETLSAGIAGPSMCAMPSPGRRCRDVVVGGAVDVDERDRRRGAATAQFGRGVGADRREDRGPAGQG